MERAILAVDGVRRTVVTAVGAGPDSRLAAYIVPAEAADSERIRAAVSAVLPDYMVPSHIVPLDRLPAGPNGKLDRAKLPVPGGALPVSREEAAASAESRPDELEVEIARIFADVLGVTHVPADADFCAQGGTSLQAVKLLTRLRRKAPDLALAVLLDQPTVRGISAAVRGAAISS